MNKSLPDKYVRKAIFTAVNGITVDGNVINCYDSRVTDESIQNYVLLSTQSNEVDKANKCENHWESNILIEVFTRYQMTGNTGSRLLADNILDEVRDLTNVLVLDVASGLEIISQRQSFPSDLTATSRNEIINRKFLRIEFIIN